MHCHDLVVAWLKGTGTGGGSDWKKGFICFTYNHNKLQQIFQNYHCLDHSQGTFNLHPSAAVLQSNLPATVANKQSFSSKDLFDLLDLLDLFLYLGILLPSRARTNSPDPLLRQLRNYCKWNICFQSCCLRILRFTGDMYFNMPVTNTIPYSFSRGHCLTSMSFEVCYSIDDFQRNVIFPSSVSKTKTISKPTRSMNYFC
jgi:hypothetical protein